jgi:hypothetical protein
VGCSILGVLSLRLQFAPGLFQESWTPPVSPGVTASADADEREAITLFTEGGLRARLVLSAPGASAALGRLRSTGSDELLREILATLRIAPHAERPAQSSVEEPAAEAEPAAPAERAVPACRYLVGPVETQRWVLELASRLRSGDLASREARVRAAYSLGRSDAERALLALEVARVVQEPSCRPSGERSLWYVVLAGCDRAFYTADRQLYHSLARLGGAFVPIGVLGL